MVTEIHLLGHLCEAQFESHPVCSSLPVIYTQTFDIHDLSCLFPRTRILFARVRPVFLIQRCGNLKIYPAKSFWIIIH